MENRIIKFRAWNPKIKEMHFSSEEILFDKREFYPWAFEIGTSGYPQSEWVFMQFTGLKDKNGKEIYEGDIVSGTNGLYAFAVTYVRHGFIAVSKDGRDEFTIPDHWEVIGNIHQNPELL